MLLRKVKNYGTEQLDFNKVGLESNKMIDFVNTAGSMLKKIGLSGIYSLRLLDLDFDGVPELMLKSKRNSDNLYPVSFYKLENNEMKKLASKCEAISGNSRIYLYYDIAAKKPVYTVIYRDYKTLNNYTLTLSEFTFEKSVKENILSFADYTFTGSNYNDISQREVKYTISGNKNTISSEEYNAYIADYLKNKIDLRLESSEQLLIGSKLTESEVKDMLSDSYLAFFYNKIGSDNTANGSWVPSCQAFLENRNAENTGWVLFDGDKDGIPEVYFYNSDGSAAPVYTLLGKEVSEIGKISAEKLYISYDYNLNEDVLVGYTSSDGNFTAVVYLVKEGKLSPVNTYKKVGESYSLNGNIVSKSEVNDILEYYFDDSKLIKTASEYTSAAVNEGITGYFFRALA